MLEEAKAVDLELTERVEADIRYEQTEPVL